MKRIVTIATSVAALLVPVAASASLAASNDPGRSVAKANNAVAKGNQVEGRLDPNTCSAAQPVTVGGPSSIQVLTAGTNAGGLLYAQVIGRSGDVGSADGYYVANSGGTYAFRVCFRSDDGIDSQISYIAAVLTTPR
jgi:hypothetical protein